MRRDHLLFRIASAAAAAALTLGLTVPAAFAQNVAPPPPPGATPAPAGAPVADPPARVGRVALLSGTVSFHGPDAQTWSAASTNYPLSNGDALWTEPSASATLEIGASRIVLNNSTEFQVETLDAKSLVSTEAQGETLLDLSAMPAGETMTVRTPRGTVTMAAAGQYDIAAGDTEHPTIVGVVSGAADVTGTGMSLHVAAGQAATITGTDSFSGNVGALARDAFVTATLARLGTPATPAGVAPPAVVASMTGCAVLAQAGTWRSDPQYGTVWYPRVAAGWRPYREGHWGWVAPWGWTWIDDAAWGFAPSHYGRWLQVDNAWAWAPSPYSPGGGAYAEVAPVYAPALVSFFGIGAAVGAAVAFGGFNSVGWVPLGPGEAYRPWYGHSESYLREVNIRNVTNVTNITNRQDVFNEFRNRGAATVASAAAIAGAQHIGARAQSLAPGQFGNARPISTGLDHRIGGAAEPRLRSPGPAIASPRAASPGLRAGAGPHIAPGPSIAAHGPEGAGPVRQGEVARVPEARPGGVPGSEVHEGPRPGEPRPGEPRQGETRQGETRPGETRPGQAARAEAPERPGEAHRPEAQVAHVAPARPAAAPARPIQRAPAQRAVVHAAPRPAARPPQHFAAPAARHAAPAAHAGGGGVHHRG